MTVSIELAGPAHISIRTQNDETGEVSRRSIVPGCWRGAVWVPTDISGESDSVRDLCAEAWTPEAIAAYKAANDMSF